MNPEVFERLRVKAGGVSALARAMDTYPQQIQHWRRSGVPSMHVVKLCQVSDGEVQPYDLRPDIFLEGWTV
jgi:DNA-binding transcriptional regulator YdaS (Cro superfamily)